MLKAGTGGDVIKIVFSDQSLVKTNNQYRLNMHQTQSFLENQTNISRILLGSFTRKTSEEKLFCLSQHVLSAAWSIIYRWLDIQQTRLGDSGFPWKFICTFHDCSAKSVRQRRVLKWNETWGKRSERLVITFKFSCNFGPSCVHLNSEHWSHLRRQREILNFNGKEQWLLNSIDFKRENLLSDVSVYFFLILL